MFKEHLIKRTLAGGLVIAATGFPPGAQAMRTVTGGSEPAVVRSAPGRFPVNSYSLRALAPNTSVSDASVRRSSQPGFEWGDAGIGAAGAVVVLGAAAVGAGMTRRRRNQRTLVS